MKYIAIIFIIFCSVNVSAQIGNFTSFPSMRPHHVLDENLEDISFAFSLRILESNYTGPLIRLRRASDNAQQDFYCGQDDKVNITAINNWRNGSNVFVVRWYDQSGLGQDAVQNTNNRQMRFFPVQPLPFIQGDGTNDFLTVDTPNGIQNVTNAGREGTVLMVTRNTSRAQNGFGVIAGSNRWVSHTNWNDGRLYFDPGFCCNNPRSFVNSANANVFEHYTLRRGNTNILLRAGCVTQASGAIATTRCTLTSDFAIGWAASTSEAAYATTSFTEFILYKTDIAAAKYEVIEESAILFWGL